MKKIITLLAVLSLVGSVFGQMVVVEGSDQFVGYDGNCRIFYSIDNGYYRDCYNAPPVFIGWEINQHTTWRHPRQHWFWNGHKNWQKAPRHHGH